MTGKCIRYFQHDDNMNKFNIHYKHYLLTATIFLMGRCCLAQDTYSVTQPIDTTSDFIKPVTVRQTMRAYDITHSPSKKDSALFNKYPKLIAAEPTPKNYRTYYALACSLWELNKLPEAEAMFLKIVSSNKPFYTGTYYHSSDIPGDTRPHTYGYGSYTSNYKNYACQYLAKINIKEKKYDQALTFVEDADNKYIVASGCGTGHSWYRRDIDGLYGLCYEGLGKYDTIISMFLPQFDDFYNGIMIRALQKMYSSQEIQDSLKNAEQSIICVVDTFQSSTFITTNYGQKSKSTEEIQYTSGTATMNLFGRQIPLSSPNLEHGEKVSKEHFIKEFRESAFYTALIGENAFSKE